MRLLINIIITLLLDIFQLDIRSLRVKLADFGLSRTVERSGNDLSLFHARWTAPEVWDDYIVDDEYIEGKITDKKSFRKLSYCMWIVFVQWLGQPDSQTVRDLGYFRLLSLQVYKRVGILGVEGNLYSSSLPPIISSPETQS